MSLPLQAVERLFARLSATYGRDFTSKFEGVDANAVKSSWAHELANFANDLPSIAWALEHLPERAPNVIEFRAIARRAPMPEVPRIEVSKAGAERVAAELKKLGPTLKALRHRTTTGGKDWAHRIIDNDRNGIRSRSSLPLKMARAALEERRVIQPGERA